MSMSWVDWSIFATVFVIVGIVGIVCRRYVKSVAGWLVAGRGVGRYLGLTANMGAMVGAVSIITMMQMGYVGGPAFWWLKIQLIGVGLICAITGWGFYRLRETKVLTLNELLERRYSRKFRIFCGFLCFFSGIINMGIFPIIGGRFFIYFCGLPQTIELWGTQISTLPLITAIFVFVATMLCLIGGQVSIVITDFIQSSIMLTMYVAVGFAVYRVVKWNDVVETLMAQKNTIELVSPFNLTSEKTFSLWFYAMMAVTYFYGALSWAPSQQKGQSAKNAREAKIMAFLGYLGLGAGVALFCFAPVACFTFMHSPVFAEQSGSIKNVLENIANPNIRTQLVVPLFLSYVLPVGLTGLFAAGILSAFISTHDTYFLTWAGVFVQDIVIPFRKKPLSQKGHLWLLKGAVIGIAIFVYLFSILYRETDYIWMFMLITGAIYTGGAGSVILGGLYWRRATTAGAWAAMITGSTMAVGGIILQQVWNKVPLLMQIAEKAPDGRLLAFSAICGSLFMYIVVSLLTTDTKFDLDKLLHRKDGVNEEVLALKLAKPKTWLRRHIYKFLWVTAIGLIGLTVYIVYYNLTHEVSPKSWLRFWKYYAFGMFFYSIPTTVWLIGGGIRDIYRLIKHLNAEKVDATDDGFVRNPEQTKQR